MKSCQCSCVRYHFYRRTFARTDDKNNNIRNGLSFSVFCASRLKSVAVDIRLRRQLIDNNYYCTRRQSVIGKIVYRRRRRSTVNTNITYVFQIFSIYYCRPDDDNRRRDRLEVRHVVAHLHRRRTSACHPL